jgi:hypothetical protein
MMGDFAAPLDSCAAAVNWARRRLSVPSDCIPKKTAIQNANPLEPTRSSGMARTCAFWFRLLLVAALLSPATGALAQISVKPDALKHYSYCVSNAKDRRGVFLLDRGTLYRCVDDIAASYFNYLGRQKAPERRAVEAEGVFIYRTIAGVGKCWNKIEDPYGNPISVYGCDIFIEL